MNFQSFLICCICIKLNRRLYSLLNSKLYIPLSPSVHCIAWNQNQKKKIAKKTSVPDFRFFYQLQNILAQISRTGIDESNEVPTSDKKKIRI